MLHTVPGHRSAKTVAGSATDLPQHPGFHSQFFRMHTVHGMYVCAVLYARSTNIFLRFPLLSWNEMLLFPVLWISLLARLLPLACPLSSHKLRNGHC